MKVYEHMFIWCFSCKVDEQVQRAFSLGLAALLGKDVYNFGELVKYCVTYCIYAYMGGSLFSLFETKCVLTSFS